jgi:CRISPR-associated protein (TIGR02710 family)
MSRILIVSLGTSPEPIINAISSLRPDRVLFVCSEISRDQLTIVRSHVPLADFDEERDVIVLQQRLSPKQGEEVINELDQLDCVYLRASQVIQQVRREQPGCELTVDYTGGTKTMTTGLAMAAIDAGGVKLNITTSDRQKNQSTLSGYSAPVPVNTSAIQARRLEQFELPALLKRFDYEAARQAVRRVLELPNTQPNSTRKLRRLEELLVALDAWDRFDHKTAVEVLLNLKDRRLDNLLLFPLKRVIASRSWLDPVVNDQKWPKMNGHGLEAVEDLLLNAERRAAQRRYDDAVGRLYRATELTAQLLLRNGVTNQVGPSGLLTEAINIELLPSDLQETYRAKEGLDGKVKLGLTASYDLLAQLNHPIGRIWQEQKHRIVDQLKIRNNSLFAHGFQPISYPAWQSLKTTLGGFLQVALTLHGNPGSISPAQQLPNDLEFLLNAEE